MSLENVIIELTLAINRLATNMQANTESGNRIINTLSNPESNYTATTPDNDDCTSLARESSEMEATAPAPAPAKRTRASRARPATPPPPEDDTPDTPEEAPQEQPAITLSDIRESALGYRDRNGLEAARALLATFNVERIGDLDFNQYAEFIKACAP